MNCFTKNFTLIELMIVVAIIAVVATIATPMLLDAKRSSNEKVSIASLRSLNTDQETYRTEKGLYGTLVELGASGKVNLSIPKSGFTFTDLIVVPTADHYAIKGVPSTLGSSGRKIFALTKTGTIRTDNAVIAGFNVSTANGITAINASTMITTIVAGNELAGVDNINTFAEAK